MTDRLLAGKVALVTGSSRGIGKAIAHRLAAAGATTVVNSRTIEVRDPKLPGTMHTVTEEIRKAGGEALAVPANLLKKEEREKLVETVNRELGGVDILVNNAAILVPGSILDFSERYYDRMFELLVKAPFHLCQLILPNMMTKKSGSIVNISSIAAVHPQKPFNRRYGAAVYGMTKAAIERFTTGLAAEMFTHHISVNSLAPNKVVATPGQMYGRKFTQEMIDAAEPVEVMAEAALALVSGDPSVLTGRLAYSQDLLDELGLTPQCFP